ncbi:MAG: BBP7 family outer membrane beta-barrel protein [Pirellulaceae bacterium]
MTVSLQNCLALLGIALALTLVSATSYAQNYVPAVPGQVMAPGLPQVTGPYTTQQVVGGVSPTNQVFQSPQFINPPVQQIYPASPLYVPQAQFAPMAGKRFYFTAELFMLTRTNRADPQSVVLDNPTLNELLSTSDLTFQYEPGLRTILGFSLGQCRYAELLYFGLHNWDDTQVVEGNDNLRIPGNLALASTDFLDADRIRVDYSGEVHNIEINYVASYPLAFVGGFRYIIFNEFFGINSLDLDSGTSDYLINTTNDLIGGQLGLRYGHCCGCWTFDATGKVGAYYNNASQNQTVNDLDNGFNFRTARGDGSTTAWTVDLGANASILLTQSLALRGGYQAIWINRVALAPDQLDFTDTPTSGTGINISGSTLLHGFNIGLELRN